MECPDNGRRASFPSFLASCRTRAPSSRFEHACFRNAPISRDFPRKICSRATPVDLPCLPVFWSHFCASLWIRPRYGRPRPVLLHRPRKKAEASSGETDARSHGKTRTTQARLRRLRSPGTSRRCYSEPDRFTIASGGPRISHRVRSFGIQAPFGRWLAGQLQRVSAMGRCHVIGDRPPGGATRSRVTSAAT